MCFTTGHKPMFKQTWSDYFMSSNSLISLCVSTATQIHWANPSKFSFSFYFIGTCNAPLQLWIGRYFSKHTLTEHTCAYQVMCLGVWCFWLCLSTNYLRDILGFLTCCFQESVFTVKHVVSSVVQLGFWLASTSCCGLTVWLFQSQVIVYQQTIAEDGVTVWRKIVLEPLPF